MTASRYPPPPLFVFKITGTNNENPKREYTVKGPSMDHQCDEWFIETHHSYSLESNIDLKYYKW